MQSGLDIYIVKNDGNVKQDLDQQISKFFYANNISFSIVEHPKYFKLITMLRNGYSPPNCKALAKKIAGLLLTATTEQLQEEVRKKLFGKDSDCTLTHSRLIRSRRPDESTCAHTGPVAATG